VTFPEELLALLACPRCKGPLTRASAREGRDELDCPGCHLAYPIREGVPQLLVDEARPTGAQAGGS
jgi:uncharacterized protein